MESSESYLARKEVALPGSRNFADLSKELGSFFCGQLERAFVQAFHTSSPNSNRFRHSSLVGFLRWVSASEDRAAEQLKSEIVANGSVTQPILREALLAWRARVRDTSDFTLTTSSRRTTRKSLLEIVSGTARRLAEVGLWPNPGRIRGFGNTRDQADDGPSLGELLTPGRTEQEFSVKEIVALNRLRLDRLRELAAAEILESHTKILKGRAFGAACTIAVPEDDAELAKLLKPLVSKIESRDLESDPIGRDCIGIIWAHSWRYRFGRLAPRHDSYRAVLRELGGSDHIRQFIIPSGEVMIAARVVVLVDSGVNVSTCEGLSVDCFEAEVVRGNRRLVRISAVKHRARGRVVSTSLVGEGGELLPVKSKDRTPSAVQVIGIWKEISEGFREIARQRVESRAEQLWIIPQQRKPELLRPGAGLIAHSVLFARFLQRHQADPILGGLGFSRRTIRKSFLQDRASRKNWSSSVVALLADHRAPSSAAPYLSRKWVRRAYDELIRQFQVSLEAAFEARLDDGETKDGDSKAALARETGLGFVCLDPSAAPPSVSPSAEGCSQVEYCAGCRSRSFAPSDTSIRQVVFLNRSLRQCAEQFEGRNPARWTTIWMPYLALTEAVIELLRQSHHRFALKGIEQALEDELRGRRLQLMEPW